MAHRVFIGGLPFNVRERDVEEFLHDFGRIRDIVMKQRYAFVEFEDMRDADDAIHELNGRKFLGSNRVSMEWARRTPRHEGGYRRSPPRRRVWSPPRPRGHRFERPYRTDNRIIIKNLSSRISWQDLKDMMREVGEVTYTDAHKIKPNEAVVDFVSMRDVRSAIEKYDGKEVNGRRLRVMNDSRGADTSLSRSPRSRSRSYSRDSRDSKSGERRTRRSRSRSKYCDSDRSVSRHRKRSRRSSLWNNKDRSNSPRENSHRS